MIISILNSVIFPIELLLASYICAVKINKRSYWGLRMVLSLFFGMRIYGSYRSSCSWQYACQRLNFLFKYCTAVRTALILDLQYFLKRCHVLLHDRICNATFCLVFLYLNVDFANRKYSSQHMDKQQHSAPLSVHLPRFL